MVQGAGRSSSSGITRGIIIYSEHLDKCSCQGPFSHSRPIPIAGYSTLSRTIRRVAQPCRHAKHMDRMFTINIVARMLRNADLG